MFILPIGWQQSNKSKTSPQHLPRGCPGILSSTPNLPPILRLQQSWSWKSWEQEFLWRSSHSASTPSICLFHKGEEEGKVRVDTTPEFRESECELHFAQARMKGEILFNRIRVSWEPDWSHLQRDLALKRLTTESLVRWKAQGSKSESLYCKVANHIPHHRTGHCRRFLVRPGAGSGRGVASRVS